jgi:carboxyl-terminal processing protease
MIKRISLFVLIICLIILPVPVHAYETSASAGRLLSQLIDLITDEYVGGEITRENLMEAAIHGMTLILDPYSEYMNAETYARFTGSMTGKLVGIGVQLQHGEDGLHKIIRVLPDTPARESGLMRGDIITMVNGQATEGLLLDEVITLIGDPNIPKTQLSVLRGTETKSFEITKREIQSTSVYMEKLEDILGETGKGHDGIRYIAVTAISQNTATALQAIIEQLQKENIEKIILDLRGNTGGYLDVAIEICNLIVPSGPACFTVDASGNRRTLYSRLSTPPFKEIIVLVDRHTASGAEIIAAALQDAGAAFIIGETTFGKGVIQSMYNLSIGGGLKLTTEEYYRRSGGKINGIGVTPDYEQETEFEDYETPRDSALLKALEILTR